MKREEAKKIIVRAVARAAGFAIGFIVALKASGKIR